MSVEHKTFTLQVESVDDDQGIITGYLSTFNNIDLGNGYIRDRVLPGAFKRTVNAAIERKAAKSKKFLWPHLWFHDPEKPIGGYVDAREDTKGLFVTYQLDISKNEAGVPNNPLATMVFSGYKSGYIDEQSIGYEVLKSEFVEEVVDGRKQTVRNLIEVRLFEGSSITSNFAMNPEATVTSVKSVKAADASSTPTIIGNTKGPIGPRDEAWDSDKAESQIWAAAYDDATGKIDEKLASKYFMVRSGDPQNKTSYGYPFWYAGDAPHICVGAVIAIAGALSGSRGANAPSALKPKIETLYRRITAKYPDDPALTPPWKSDTDEKGATMNRQRKANNASQPKQRKTFAEHYAEEQCADLLEDWQDVVLCALTAAVYDAFQIGDQPEADVRDALTAFNAAVMAWVDQGVQYGLSDYIDDQTDEYSSAENRMQYGSDSRPNYGYMSRGTPGERKAMAESDATTGGFTAEHMDKLKSAAQKAMKKVADHAATLHDMADGISDMVSGTKARQAKEGRAFSTANTQALQDHADSLHDQADTLQKGMQRQMKAITSVADDLATVLQGSEAAYGTDPGTPQSGEQENKAGTPSHATRSPQQPPSDTDTVTEDEINALLADLQALRTPA